MRLGPLRQRVNIQARSTTVDAFGQESETWATVYTVWASVEPLSGRELLAAQQVQGETTHRVRMRFQAGITTSHRILFNLRPFNIQSVINKNEAGAFLELLCTEGPSNG